MCRVTGNDWRIVRNISAKGKSLTFILIRQILVLVVLYSYNCVIVLKGEVNIAPPLQGLRWRLDPGPTHLDTCTFQALSEDGTVLQYRGFIDRGARVEARFSGRPIKIRGSVMFQMRYLGGSADYWKEMLPINYMPGATKFEMKKKSS